MPKQVDYRNEKVTYIVDVLTDAKNIGLIANRMKEPSIDLTASFAEVNHLNRTKAAERLRSMVAFTPVYDSLSIHNRDTAWKFRTSMKHYEEFVDSHLDEVSQQFPEALFLVEYIEMPVSYSSKWVTLSGDTLQCTYEEPLDIFAPFRAEYQRGLPAGTLWEKWLADMSKAVTFLQGRDLQRGDRLRACGGAAR